jgi:hypothetical protein
MLGFGKSKKEPAAAPRKADVEAGFGTGLLAHFTPDPTVHTFDVPTDVVGEELLLDDIKAVFSEAGMQTSANGVEVNGFCALLPQPEGAYGHFTVAVVVAGRCVGYLPTEIAGIYAPKLSALAAQGQALQADVRIWIVEKADSTLARTSLYLPKATAL